MTQKVTNGLKKTVDKNIARQRHASDGCGRVSESSDRSHDGTSSGSEVEFSDNDAKATETKIKLLFTVTITYTMNRVYFKILILRP